MALADTDASRSESADVRRVGSRPAYLSCHPKPSPMPSAWHVTVQMGRGAGVAMVTVTKLGRDATRHGRHDPSLVAIP